LSATLAQPSLEVAEAASFLDNTVHASQEMVPSNFNAIVKYANDFSQSSYPIGTEEITFMQQHATKEVSKLPTVAHPKPISPARSTILPLIEPDSQATLFSRETGDFRGADSRSHSPFVIPDDSPTPGL